MKLRTHILISILLSFSMNFAHAQAQQTPAAFQPKQISELSATLQLVTVATPTAECADVYTDMVTYLESEKLSYASTKSYIDSIYSSFKIWEERFEEIETLSQDQKTDLLIPEKFFEPMAKAEVLLLQESAQILENSGRLEDAFYTWLDAAPACGVDDALLQKFDDYGFETRTLDALVSDAIGRYAPVLTELAGEYSQLEGVDGTDVTLGTFSKFAKLVSVTEGKGGFGELKYLFEQLREGSDLVILEELVEQLKPEEAPTEEASQIID